MTSYEELKSIFFKVVYESVSFRFCPQKINVQKHQLQIKSFLAKEKTTRLNNYWSLKNVTILLGPVLSVSKINPSQQTE